VFENIIFFLYYTQVGTTGQFNLTYLAGPLGLLFTMDYGDGETGVISTNAQYLQKNYAIPGEYIVTAAANDGVPTVGNMCHSLYSIQYTVYIYIFVLKNVGLTSLRSMSVRFKIVFFSNYFGIEIITDY